MAVMTARPARTASKIPLETCDVLIVGAGAAGLLCAREAASQGLRVIVLEAAAKPGRKIAICGGGKANFSNRQILPEHYFCGHPEGAAFCAPALAAFGAENILAHIRAWKLPFEERGHGQLFLTVSAERLVDALVHDCHERGCRVICNATVESIVPPTPGQAEQGYHIQAGTMNFRARHLVLAAGSAARPQSGGSGAGYRLAQSLGLKVIAPRPALTPLLLAKGHCLRDLSGISLPVRISLAPNLAPNMAEAATGPSFEDDLLFTHDGLSGPAILKASLFWSPGMPLQCNFLLRAHVNTLLNAPEAGRSSARSLLCKYLPQRLVDAILPQDTARRKVAELSRASRLALHTAVHAHELIPAGLAGLKRAEVCAGGVDTRELAPHSMAAVKHTNLYVIGELQDVTGLLGGYNLHWAWASGAAAGKAISCEGSTWTNTHFA